MEIQSNMQVTPTLEIPTELVNNSLEKLKAFNNRSKIFAFCKAADSLGFTKDQVIEMVKSIPDKKANKSI
jgi:hypothetical protein